MNCVILISCAFVLQKPPVVGGKAGTGASAAAKSRLAAVKAAMRAKQAEQKATETSDNIQDDSNSVPTTPASTLPAQTVVFNGGFFQVESPIKPSGKIEKHGMRSYNWGDPLTLQVSKCEAQQCVLLHVSS